KIYNIEELATLWHFPVEASVKAPLIQKAPGRKAEPPMSLPVGKETVGEELFEEKRMGKEDIFSDVLDDEKEKADGKEEIIDLRVEKKIEEDIFAPEESEEEPVKKSAPPSNLPFA
ncbi:hypothetical protein DRH27_05950, partial [Candidatus Falkowbacteria bacterium]